MVTPLPTLELGVASRASACYETDLGCDCNLLNAQMQGSAPCMDCLKRRVGGEGRGCAEQSQIVHTNLTLRLGCRYVTV